MTKRQTLELEVMRAVQRYRIDSHKSVTEGVQTAVEILGKFAPYPDSIKRFIEVPKPVNSSPFKIAAYALICLVVASLAFSACTIPVPALASMEPVIKTVTNTVYIVEVHEETLMDLMEGVER